jgi:hypothetical protein
MSDGGRESPVSDTLEADYRWCRQQRDLLASYSGQVVVFHNRTILGNGVDHHAALENARARAVGKDRALPAHGLLFLVVPEPLPVASSALLVLPDH